MSDRAERLRRLRNFQSKDFYPALVIRPITIAVLWVIADWKIITPNRLTHLGNLCKVGAAVSLFAAAGDDAYRWLAIALLHAGIIADNADGTLARYRQSWSSFGSFYDKASDLLTWFPIAVGLGWLAYQQLGDPLMLILATTHAYALGALGYMKWVAHAETERLAWRRAADDPSVVEEKNRPPSPGEPPDRSAGQWLRWFGRSAAQIVRFDEMDLVFWISLGLILDELELLLWVLAITQCLGVAIMFIKRGLEVRWVDREMGR